MTRFAFVGGALLLVLVITLLVAPRSVDATALSFLVLGPKPAPGQHGVFAVAGGSSTALTRAPALNVDLADPHACPASLRLEGFSAIGVDADRLLLVVYGASPDGACLVPVTTDADVVHLGARAGGSTAPLHVFAVALFPLFTDMYLLRTSEPIGRGDWVLYLPRPAEAWGHGNGPALYALRVH